MKSVATFFLVGLALADETCYLPIDLVFLQDTTGSFHDDLPHVTDQIPGLMAAVSESNPNSFFGVTEFRDKPYNNLGLPDDYCYKLTSTLSANETIVQQAYGGLLASGGGDLPEAQLEALANLILDGSVGWRGLGDASRDTTVAGARVVVLSTDATPHDPQDYFWYNGRWEYPWEVDAPQPPYQLNSWPEDPSQYTVDDLCRNFEYPYAEQIKGLLTAYSIYVVILVPQDDENVVKKWQEINAIWEQPESFVQFISADSSDISEVVVKAAAEVTKYACTTTTTTTTAAPTTTTTTTTAAPTTTTTTTTTAAPTTTTTTTTTAAPTTTTTTTAAPTTTTTTTTTTAAPTTTTTTTTTTVAPTTTTVEIPPTVTEVGTTGEITIETSEAGSCTCVDHPCGCGPAVVVRVNDAPKRLVVEYEQ